MQFGVGEVAIEYLEEVTEKVNKRTNRREERNVGIKERKGGRKIGVFKRM
jgi:hypothetical protein